MLDRRAQILLKTLVERYIAEGEPVGSRTLSRHSGLDLSPATIRNVMADLEELGLVTSPHTSAGRVPTPQGLRFFVDALLVMRPLDSRELHQIEDQLHPDSLQRAAQTASQLLSELTHYAGVVRMPRMRSLTFRQIEFLRLSAKRILLIIVTPQGDVQNRILLTEREYLPSELIEAANILNEHYSGQTFEEIRSRLHRELGEIRQDIIALMTAALETGHRAVAEEAEPVVLAGESNLLAVRDLSQDLNRLRQLFELFERKTALLQILDQSLRADGVRIFIGGESGVATPEEVSVVAAPYKVHGEVVGTLGVIGPTRMAYDRVVPIVDVTAKMLSSALSQS